MCYLLKVADDSVGAIISLMLIAIDTNVMWQALYNATGPSGFILDLVLNEKVDLTLSQATHTEYTDVLLRPTSIERFNADPEDVNLILDGVAGLAQWQTIWFKFRPNLRDEADNMFVELAVSACADFLITNNIGDFTRQAELKFDDLNIIRPKEFVYLWRMINE